MTSGTVRTVARSDADTVVAARAGDAAAFAELFDRWFDRCFDVARNIVRNDDTAADVAQDVFLTAYQRLDTLADPDKFGGWILRISRNKALNRLQKEQRSRPQDGTVMTDLHDRSEHDDLVGSNRLTDTPAISEARDRQEMVWAAAAALGERESSILDLHLRHHLTAAEIAEELDITANNAHQLLYRLRAKLGDAVANHQIWRKGRPVCSDLRKLNISSFDADGNKLIQRHRSACAECSEQHRHIVDPAKMFAAAPIAVAPLLLRQRAAAALEAAGVPANPAAHGGQGGSASRRHRRSRRMLVGTMAAAVVAVAVVAVAVSPAGDPESAGPPVVEAGSTTTATTERSVVTTEATSPSTTEATEPDVSEVTETSETTETTDPPIIAPPPPPPAEELEIVRFFLGDPDDVIFCANTSDVAVRAGWFVTGADELTLSTAGATSTDVTDADGWTFCAPSGTLITLSAFGGGESRYAEAFVP